MRQVYCLGNPQETSSRRVDGQSSVNTIETAFGVSSSGNAAQTVDTPSPPSSKTSISKIIPVLKNKTKAKIVDLNVFLFVIIKVTGFNLFLTANIPERCET